MVNELVERSLSYIMNQDYDRIKKGKRLNILNLPYNISYLNTMISYFEETENYEKCNFILSFKNDILDHDKNYYKDISINKIPLK